LIRVRREEPDDIPTIYHINERAFNQPAEAYLVDALRRNGAVILSLVAVDDDRIVGHILFSPVVIESENARCDAVGLAPMAVLPEYQGRGIGSMLVRRGLEELRAMGHEIVVVLGHPGFYPRFGFMPSRPHGITSTWDVPDDVFMVAELREGALARCSGVVKYRHEFDAV
jgi:putative acetyltransferase